MKMPKHFMSIVFIAWVHILKLGTIPVMYHAVHYRPHKPITLEKALSLNSSWEV